MMETPKQYDTTILNNSVEVEEIPMTEDTKRDIFSWQNKFSQEWVTFACANYFLVLIKLPDIIFNFHDPSLAVL